MATVDEVLAEVEQKAIAATKRLLEENKHHGKDGKFSSTGGGSGSGSGGYSGAAAAHSALGQMGFSKSHSNSMHAPGDRVQEAHMALMGAGYKNNGESKFSHTSGSTAHVTHSPADGTRVAFGGAGAGASTHTSHSSGPTSVPYDAPRKPSSGPTSIHY